MPNQPLFTARIVKGSGKGGAQGIPTVNLDLADVPADLEEGIYAARVTIERETFDAAVHYGPRPVHGLGRSFEAHLLTKSEIRNPKPERVSVELLKRLRDVRDFENKKELKEQIERDIKKVTQIFDKK